MVMLLPSTVTMKEPTDAANAYDPVVQAPPRAGASSAIPLPRKASTADPHLTLRREAAPRRPRAQPRGSLLRGSRLASQDRTEDIAIHPLLHGNDRQVMIYVFGDCELDTCLYTLQRAGQTVRLRPKVFRACLYLLEHRDRVVSREELCVQVWPGQFISQATLEGVIRAVR